MAGFAVEFGREGRGDADVGVVRQFGRVKHGAVRVFVAQGDFPAFAARFCRRRGVQVAHTQPQRLFAGVGDAYFAVMRGFFEVGQGRGFAVDFDGGVSSEFGRDGRQAHQPGEFLGAQVAVVREGLCQGFALFVVEFGQGVSGVLRVVFDVLPQGFQLFEADEVVRGEAGRAAVRVAVAVFDGSDGGKALARGLVFAKQREGGGNVEAVVAVEFVAGFAVVAQEVAPHGFARIGQGVVGVAVAVRAFGVVAAVGVFAQVFQQADQL